MADLTGLVKDMAFEYLPLVIKYFNGLPLQNNLSHYMERNGQYWPVPGLPASLRVAMSETRCAKYIRWLVP